MIDRRQKQYRVVMFGNSLIENGSDWVKQLGRNKVESSGVDTVKIEIQLLLNAVLYTNQPGKTENRKRTADRIDGINAYLL